MLSTFSINLETFPGVAPKRWFDTQRHRYVALDAAIEQGALFCNLLAENPHERE